MSYRHAPRHLVLAAIALTAAMTSASLGQTINWTASAKVIGGGPEPASAGAPDAITPSPVADVDLSSFSITQSYSGLAAFLGVSQATLDRANFIAWDINGGDFSLDTRWESARFKFQDGTSSIMMDYVEHPGGGTISGDTFAFLADGSILAPAYYSYFGISSPVTASFCSYVLFNLAGFDLSHLSVDIISGRTAGLAGAPDYTPDVDAAGTVPAPWTALPLSLVGGLSCRRRAAGLATGRSGPNQ